MSVHKKLMQARIRLQNTKLKKSGHNKFANYYYFELGDFLSTVQEIFNDVGLCGVVSFTATEATLTITDVGDMNSIVIHSPMGSAQLKGCFEVQNIGAVETYQRRYLWVSAMEIVEHDILDAVKDKPESNEVKSIKGPGPVITVKSGIGEDLPEEEKEFLREMAESCTTLVQQGKAKEAYAMIKENKLEDDQTVWLSSQLASDIRSAIKKAKLQ